MYRRYLSYCCFFFRFSYLINSSSSYCSMLLMPSIYYNSYLFILPTRLLYIYFNIRKLWNIKQSWHIVLTIQLHTEMLSLYRQIKWPLNKNDYSFLYLSFQIQTRIILCKIHLRSTLSKYISSHICLIELCR